MIFSRVKYQIYENKYLRLFQKALLQLQFSVS